MNLQSYGQKLGQKLGRATEARPGASGDGGAGAGQPRAEAAKPGTTNQAVLGPFTVRDLAVFAATLILFVASLLPMFAVRYNLWNLGSLFFLGLGIVLPLIVSALFAARRLSPATKIRIGSLSIDQFASVVASFSVAFFFLSVAGAYVPTLLAGLIGSLLLFAATVLGRFIPFFAGDFLGREESPAHVVARESAVPLPKPHTPKVPKPAADTAAASRPGVPAASAAPAAEAHAGSSALHTGPFSVATPDASHSAATPAAAAPSAAEHAPAAAFSSAPSAAEPVPEAAASFAPEEVDWTASDDSTPATRAADVVPPAAAATAAEETQIGDLPTAGTAAAASAGTATDDGGTPDAASARPAPAEPDAATAVHQQVRREEPIGATVDPASRPEESDEQPVHEAFWFAVAQHRTAVDPQTGAPAFVIEPGGWVLALEDRGDEFLVQHTDGRVGLLRDLSNIERG
jgi:hypothetical protein